MTAFRAVLDDIAQRGVETIYCLGDMIGKGPCSPEVADLTRELCPVVLRGNWEDAVANRTFEPGRLHYWHQQQLGPKRLKWLGKLPLAHEFWFSGQRVRLIHATPQTLHSKLGLDRTYDEWLEMFENTPLLGLNTPSPDILLCGHTHRSHVVNLSDHGKLLINTGSVGSTTDLFKFGSYLILEGVMDSEKMAPFSYQIVRFSYDVEAELAVARTTDMPDRAWYEFEQRNANYRGALPDFQAAMAARRARDKEANV